MTEAQLLLQIHLAELGIETVPEYRFMDGREWAFDLACPERKVAFEADGGKWSGGHRRGEALTRDYERQNTAMLLGWKVLRFTNDYILDGRAKAFVERWGRKVKAKCS